MGNMIAFKEFNGNLPSRFKHLNILNDNSIETGFVIIPKKSLLSSLKHQTLINIPAVSETVAVDKSLL